MIFINLAQVLRSQERFRFTVHREGDDLVVLLEPLLSGDSTDTLAPEIRQARAYLATPLHCKGSPASLDEEFSQRLTGYAQARQALAVETETLQQRLREAAKETRAKSVAASARNSKTDPAARGASPPAKATSTAPEANVPSTSTGSKPSHTAKAEDEKPLTLF